MQHPSASAEGVSPVIDTSYRTMHGYVLELPKASNIYHTLLDSAFIIHNNLHKSKFPKPFIFIPSPYFYYVLRTVETYLLYYLYLLKIIQKCVTPNIFYIYIGLFPRHTVHMEPLIQCIQ